MQDAKGAHRTGSEWAALTIIASSVFAYTLYASSPNVLTGTLLGLAGAWIGLTIQHCGNHGAMSTNTWVNNFMGLTDDLIGGSSLMWSALHHLLPAALSRAQLDFWLHLNYADRAWSKNAVIRCDGFSGQKEIVKLYCERDLAFGR
jgi:hypothetical protein